MYGAIGAIRTAHAIETQKHLQWSPEGMDSTKTPRTTLFSKNDPKFSQQCIHLRESKECPLLE